MSSKTRFGETSREKIRMVRPVLLDTPFGLLFWTIGSYVWQLVENRLGPADRYVKVTLKWRSP